MNIVGSRFCDHIDYGAGVATIFGIERVGEHAELFNAVRRRLHGWKVDELVIGVAAVHAEVVGAPTAAID